MRNEHLTAKTPEIEMGFLPHSRRLHCIIPAARGFVTTDALAWLAREHVAVLIVRIFYAATPAERADIIAEERRLVTASKPRPTRRRWTPYQEDL